MSDSDSSCKSDEIPNSVECKKRSNMFIESTNSNSVMAMLYLQRRKWDVKRAVSLYNKEQKEGIVSYNLDSDSDINGECFVRTVKTTNRIHLKVMSWNINCLESRSKILRLLKIANEINAVAPHILLLQEVDSESFLQLKTTITLNFGYSTYKEGYYFCVTGWDRTYFDFTEQTVQKYVTTTMQRGMLLSKLRYVNANDYLVVINTHLESTYHFSSIRVKQLTELFNKMKSLRDYTVIGGGDVNLRDHEVGKIGGLPNGIEDLWISCGSNRICRYTWNTKYNDTIVSYSHGKFRFDRMYIKRSEQSPRTYKVKHFELKGLQKPLNCSIHPSDHWAILAHLFVDKKTE